eukprot:2267256-Karenia_brevis.AAC.1
MINKYSWSTVMAGAWKEREKIHLLEGSVTLLAVRRLSRRLRSRNKRLLVLGDNMAVVLALSKGRASDFHLLSICRRVAAH